MKIIFQGQEAIIRKENFYCKAGPYEHKLRIGWVLEVNGEIVLGQRLKANGSFGAERFDYPEYRTRRSLLEDVKYYDK